MQTRRLLCVVLGIMLLTCSFAGADSSKPDVPPPPVTVEKVEYKGWPDAWRIRNDSCELIIVPAVSRVMHFSLAGGKNLLWENPALAGKTFPKDEGVWHNIGGEKLWPTQQKVYFKKFTGHDSWPPPWPWDGGPSEAQPIANGIRLTLPHDARFGAHAVREFTLDAKKPMVHVHQWIEKTEGEPAEMTIWTICQVNNPALSLLPSADGKFALLDKPSPRIQAKAGAVFLGREEKQSLKIGIPATDQNGWVASVFAFKDADKSLMLIQSHKLTKEGTYPDQGLQAELYASPGNAGHYTEMELLSPLVALKAGERLEDDAIWQFIPFAGDEYVAAAKHAHEEALAELK
jgi:hypothetical protein